jgi:hypothetical protein
MILSFHFRDCANRIELLQFNDESRSICSTGIQLNGSAVIVDDLSDDKQAEPSTVAVPFGRKKWSEYVFSVLG